MKELELFSVQPASYLPQWLRPPLRVQAVVRAGFQGCPYGCRRSDMQRQYIARTFTSPSESLRSTYVTKSMSMIQNPRGKEHS